MAARRMFFRVCRHPAPFGSDLAGTICIVGEILKHIAGNVIEAAVTLRRLWLFVMLAATQGMLASAHEVRPMRAVLASGTYDTVITVTNTRDYELPIEIVVQKRTVQTDGSQSFSPAEEDFLVFPPQFLLEPGQSQAVRVEFIGDRTFSESQAYIIDVQEVPVVPDNFSGVVTVYNFGAALYLTAANARADMRIENVQEQGGAVTFELVNRGRDFGFLTQTGLVIQKGSAERQFDRDELSELVENPIIPPNSTRSFRLEHGLQVDGPVSVKFPARQP